MIICTYSSSKTTLEPLPVGGAVGSKTKPKQILLWVPVARSGPNFTVKSYIGTFRFATF